MNAEPDLKKPVAVIVRAEQDMLIFRSYSATEYLFIEILLYVVYYASYNFEKNVTHGYIQTSWKQDLDRQLLQKIMSW